MFPVFIFYFKTVILFALYFLILVICTRNGGNSYKSLKSRNKVKTSDDFIIRSEKWKTENRNCFLKPKRL